MLEQQYSLRNLSLNIYRLRNKKGFTIERFAERLDVTPRQVYNWESGKNTPKLEKLVEIARELGETIDSLLMNE